MPQSEYIPIINLRGIPVLIDADLARLYGVTTKRLNEQVKRNAKRFPRDFRYRLTQAGKSEVVANCDHLCRQNSPKLIHLETPDGKEGRKLIHKQFTGTTYDALAMVECVK